MCKNVKYYVVQCSSCLAFWKAKQHLIHLKDPPQISTHLLLKPKQNRESQDEDDRGWLRHGIQRDGNQLQTPIREPHIDPAGQPRWADRSEAGYEGQHQLGSARDEVENQADQHWQHPFDNEVVHHHRQREVEVL